MNIRISIYLIIFSFIKTNVDWQRLNSYHRNSHQEKQSISNIWVMIRISLSSFIFFLFVGFFVHYIIYTTKLIILNILWHYARNALHSLFMSVHDISYVHMFYMIFYTVYNIYDECCSVFNLPINIGIDYFYKCK